MKTPSPGKEEEKDRETYVTPGVMKVKLKRLESKVRKVEAGASPLGRSPGRKGRLIKGTEGNGKFTGRKISSIIQMLKY